MTGTAISQALYGVRKLETGGRPKYRVDWELVARMAACHMTGVQIAECMGVTLDTLSIECKRDNAIGLREFLDANKVQGKQKLAQKLLSMAIEDGNAQVAIHLSKHWLGMHDRKDVNVQSSHTLHLEALRQVIDGRKQAQVEDKSIDFVELEAEEIDIIEQSDDDRS